MTDKNYASYKKSGSWRASSIGPIETYKPEKESYDFTVKNDILPVIIFLGVIVGIVGYAIYFIR